MGCATSSSLNSDPASQAASKKISRQLAKDAAREESITKLLLLGAGDSGKSTIMKQVY